MFVWCESFHGLGTDASDNALAPGPNIQTIYGINNYDAAVNNDISLDYDNGQPALTMAYIIPSNGGLTMGPGITGNHRFTSQSDWYVHFSYTVRNDDTGDSQLVQFLDTTVFPSATIQCIFAIVDDGPNGDKWVLYAADGTTVLVQSTVDKNAKQPGNYYIQLHANIGSSGSSKLIISGVEIWDVSGIDTQGTVNATANAISFRNSNFNRATTISNIVIADGRADGFTPSFNTLLGEFVVAKIQPNDVGDSNDFNPTGTASPNNWENVNDYPNPGNEFVDTDYNETSTSGNKDIFHYEDIGTVPGNVIYGINLRTLAKKTDAGTRQLRHIIKPSTTQYNGFSHALLSTYTWFSDIEDTNQDTSNRYSDSEINTHQFGYELL